MPIYEYECEKNGHRFEAMQRISDKPLETCKFCGSNVRRLISSSNFVLKGGGWYAQNYEKSSTKNATKKENKSDSPSPAPSTKEKPKKEGSKKQSSE